MNCLDRIKIQKYMDNELYDLQSEQVRSHLSECEKCQVLYAAALTDKKWIESFLSQIQDNDEPISIPEFNLSIIRRPFTVRSRVSVILKIAAGIAIIIGIFWIINTRISHKQPQLSEADLVVLELLGDTEPNKAWHDTQTVFIITNDKGEVIHSFISNENKN